MNRLENWFCSSSFWRAMTRREVLPWVLQGAELGEHVLEIGAGPGAGTEELRKRAPRVTSLEYSHEFAAGIARRDFQGTGGDGENQVANERARAGGRSRDVITGCENAAVVQGDASALPFPDKTFSAAIAVLVLHHLKSQEAQDRAFTEVFRVLRPGGVFLAMDIPDGWLHRVAHIRSTFVPLAPAIVPARLATAGFSNVQIACRSGAFRVQAIRAWQ